MEQLEQIAFLRGVNLGKHNKVPMQDLTAFLRNLGIEEVKTLLASGNVYLKNNSYSEQELQDRLSERYGFSIPVMLRTKSELLELYGHPLFEEPTTMVLFLKQAPTSEQRTMLSEIITDPFVVMHHSILIAHSESYHKTKFTNNYFERILSMHGSIRNKNTVTKVFALFEKNND